MKMSIQFYTLEKATGKKEKVQTTRITKLNEILNKLLHI